VSGAPAGTGQLIGQRLGKYEVVALLALGGTAEIYLARIDGAAGFEKYVVVKCLHDHLADDTEFVRMFLDEARLAAQLDHSNIVQTFELGQHQGRYFMAMEFLAGLSLAMVIRRVAERVDGGKLPLPLILDVIVQTCAGLHYAHERTNSGQALNVVHRDISPQNLVISFEGVVKLVDFGIARAEQRETKTKAGTIKGKFAYMSPEQCVSTAVDRRTDVFALGVILHELLTGRRLFKRANQYDTYQAVIECKVSPPSDFASEVDAGLDAVVMKALAKDKEQRYASAEAFGDAIQRYMHQRAMRASAADLAAFFEKVFAQEIDEHAGRMRELIAGREFASGGSTGVNWDAEGSDKSELSLDTSDISEISEHSSSALLEDDDGPPPEEGAEKTRIEMNPLGAGAIPDAGPRGRANGKPAVPLPAPPTGPMRAEVVDALARTAQRDTPPEVARAIAQRDRKPGSKELPTVLIEPQRASGDFADIKTQLSPELAPTALGGGPVAPAYGDETRPEQQVLPDSGELVTRDGRPPGHGSQPMLAQPSGPYGIPGPGGPPFPPHMGMPGPGMMPPGLPHGGPVGPGGYPMAGGLPLPAHLVSPAPGGYHGGHDLAHLASQPIKRVPTWLLGLIFAGALFGALLLTIIFARACR
jgi:serine/threonine protein kinase